MYIGLDIGGSAVKGVLADGNGRLLGFAEINTPGKIKEFEQDIIKLVDSLTVMASIGKDGIKCIGIGAAGSIDRKRGVIIKSANIRFLDGYRIVKKIEKSTGIKTVLENDATAAAMGVWWVEGGSRYSEWILMTLGTGIGGGLFIGNSIYTGSSGNSMEIGHMTIDYNGKKCNCGSSGCLERYASATAIVESAESLIGEYPSSSIIKRTMNEKLSSRIIYEEAMNKDRLALRVFNEASTCLGYGVANLINIFNPEAIFFGGGLSGAREIMMPVVKKTVKKRIMPGMGTSTKYIVIRNFKTTPALGAAKIAMDSVSNP
ncbi:MAG: ROK family protein [Spirochaetes bacterium]|jgi:glucokinase|nr:ROK family protein [Spirochaetota bacterium]